MSENQQLPVSQNSAVNRSPSPVGQLKTNRGLLRFIGFTILTLGIYPLVFYSGISNDINVIASRYDGKKTMHYCLLFFLVAPLTLGIGYLVWNHHLCNRIGAELNRRRKAVLITASTFWLWNVLGSLILIGPFVFTHKLADAMNTLAADYNSNG